MFEASPYGAVCTPRSSIEHSMALTMTKMTTDFLQAKETITQLEEANAALHAALRTLLQRHLLDPLDTALLDSLASVQTRSPAPYLEAVVAPGIGVQGLKFKPLTVEVSDTADGHEQPGLETGSQASVASEDWEVKERRYLTIQHELQAELKQLQVTIAEKESKKHKFGFRKKPPELEASVVKPLDASSHSKALHASAERRPCYISPPSRGADDRSNASTTRVSTWGPWGPTPGPFAKRTLTPWGIGK